MLVLKLDNISVNFHPLEAVDRGSEAQLSSGWKIKLKNLVRKGLMEIW